MATKLKRVPEKLTALTHDELRDLIIALRKQITPERAASLFLASLSTRRLDWRSILGSYAVFLHFEKHAYERGRRPDCLICGYDPKHPAKVSTTTFNDHREETGGGIMHFDPEYAVCDFDYCLTLPGVAPIKADIAAFRACINALRALPANTRLTAARDAMSGHFKANRQERQLFLEVLGYCGILQSSKVPGYFAGWVNADDREEPDGPAAEWCYPMSWWTGTDGVNEQALQFWFPRIA